MDIAELIVAAFLGAVGALFVRAWLDDRQRHKDALAAVRAVYYEVLIDHVTLSTRLDMKPGQSLMAAEVSDEDNAWREQAWPQYERDSEMVQRILLLAGWPFTVRERVFGRQKEPLPTRPSLDNADTPTTDKR